MGNLESGGELEADTGVELENEVIPQYSVAPVWLQPKPIEHDAVHPPMCVLPVQHKSALFMDLPTVMLSVMH